jgi:hypothetical protein
LIGGIEIERQKEKSHLFSNQRTAQKSMCVSRKKESGETKRVTNVMQYGLK